MDPQRNPSHTPASYNSNGVSAVSLSSEVLERRRRRQIRRIYALQVKGFVEAAEVVGADPEVLEDILDGFSLGSDGEDEELANIDDNGDLRLGFEDDDANTKPAAAEDDVYEEEDFPFYAEAEAAWKADEIKEMMHTLKEQGKAYFIQEYVKVRRIPIPKLLYAFGIILCQELRQKRIKTLLYFLDVAITRELESREKLPMYNTVDDAVDLIRNSKRMIILTGAGISVSCGIPDFRSRNGLYATLQARGEYNLDDPQQMFDIRFFKENPSVFYSFASQIYPSNFIPSPCHRFIKLIEDKGKLLRNYTQNIDTLESRAGVKRVINCHGSFATASCINCHHRLPGNSIEQEVMNHQVPLCQICPPTPIPPPIRQRRKRNGKKRRTTNVWEEEDEEEPDLPEYPPGIIKPDITFFGEKLSDEYDKALIEDRSQVDLLLVIGTSLKVSPVSEMLSHLPHSVPQILINKTPVKHANPDIILLGNADDVVQHLCRKLQWDLPEAQSNGSTLNVRNKSMRKRPSEEGAREPQRVGQSHVWLFEGAEGGKWVEEIERQYQQDEHSDSSASPPAPSRTPSQPTSTDDLPRTKKARTTRS
ncbi:DHS-like NAD/FAD-binding domain-containing protein [Abortiporus biennis]|nr:DHS-like NAD/FAD-binding domain-containing protein [Abortiporus biennis]